MLLRPWSIVVVVPSWGVSFVALFKNELAIRARWAITFISGGFKSIRSRGSKSLFSKLLLPTYRIDPSLSLMWLHFLRFSSIFKERRPTRPAQVLRDISNDLPRSERCVLQKIWHFFVSFKATMKSVDSSLCGRRGATKNPLDYNFFHYFFVSLLAYRPCL